MAENRNPNFGATPTSSTWAGLTPEQRAAYLKDFNLAGLTPADYDKIEAAYDKSHGSGTTPGDSLEFDEWLYTPEGQQKLKSFGGRITPDQFEKMRRDYEASRPAIERENLEETIAPTIDDATIKEGDLKHLESGPDLDYSEAIAALYDPSQIERDTTGRDIQLEGVDYYRDLLDDGTDAVSTAFYEGQRDDSEQAARAQREAAMMQLEETGRDTGGAGILTELSAASDIARDTNKAALRSAAMMQERRDNAAGKFADLGGDIQGGDDDWLQYYTDEQVGYGQDKSGILQTEEANNWDRDNFVSDSNVGIDNKATYHNKGLPMTAYEMYFDTTDMGRGDAAVSAAKMEEEAERERVERERRRKERSLGKFAEDVGDTVGRGIDTGAKIYGFGKGK